MHTIDREYLLRCLLVTFVEKFYQILVQLLFSIVQYAYDGNGRVDSRCIINISFVLIYLICIKYRNDR